MPVPFSSKDYNKTNLVNIANSSTIINNTITSSDIADSSIINNNFANGSITTAKLSTALQNILIGFGNRLTALETPPPPPVIEGWFGTFILSNVIASGSNHRHFHAYLAYNNVAITNSVQINAHQSHTFVIQGQDRLPLSTSTLQLKITAQSGTTGLSVSAYDGFSITNFTSTPPTQENTLTMLVNSNKLNNGVLSASFTITYVPPPPPPPSGWSGTITFNRTFGGGEPLISLRTDTEVITTEYDYNNESDTFSVSLANAQSYVEIAINLYGDWEIYSQSFSPSVGNPYVYNQDVYEWYRYSIATNTQSNLTYNFETFYDD